MRLKAICNIPLLSALLFLAGCDDVEISKFSNLTPEHCRMYGVAVHDNDTITGSIVKSECKTFAGLEKECGTPMVGGVMYAGCAKGVEDTWPSPSKQYEIYYADCGPPGSCNAYHEACHGLYETRSHTTAFNLKTMQGNQFAACPEEK